MPRVERARAFNDPRQQKTMAKVNAVVVADAQDGCAVVGGQIGWVVFARVVEDLHGWLELDRNAQSVIGQADGGRQQPVRLGVRLGRCLCRGSEARRGGRRGFGRKCGFRRDGILLPVVPVTAEPDGAA